VPGEEGDGKQFVRVSASDVAAITARILADLPIHDLTIEDPPIEDVIERAFKE
jgi:ABC-2 type transport system ATP-binding protein